MHYATCNVSLNKLLVINDCRTGVYWGSFQCSSYPGKPVFRQGKHWKGIKQNNPFYF